MKHNADKPLFITDFRKNVPIEKNKIYLVIHAAEQITSSEFRSNFIGKLVEFVYENSSRVIRQLKFDVSKDFNASNIFQPVESIYHIEELQPRSSLCKFCERPYEKDQNYWKCPKQMKNKKFSFNCISECNDFRFLANSQMKAVIEKMKMEESNK